MWSSSNISWSDLGSSTDSPFCFSIYILDALKTGKLFDYETYKQDSITQWSTSFVSKLVELLPLPSGITKNKLQQELTEQITKVFQDTKFQKILKPVDMENKETIKTLIQENKELCKINHLRLEEQIRKSDFPSYLWMEYSRYYKAYEEATDIFENLISKTVYFKPKKSSQISEKNRQIKTHFKTHFKLIDNYLAAISTYMHMNLFLDLWHDQDDSNNHSTLFDNCFFEFHNSVNNLRSALLRFKPVKPVIESSRPTD
ncbi:MAG: hypothetical protein FWH37_08495 [Candidatus Bathyarchaeota archaeon]|nr:hypothetical protein [Candidatus Termiticorpusculum sp.]